MTAFATIATQPFDWKLFLIIWALAVLGAVAALPYGLAQQRWHLERVELPFSMGRLLVLQVAQGVILFGAATATGLFLAGRLGLGLPLAEKWLAGEAVWAELGPLLLLSSAVGLLIGALVVLLDRWVIFPAVEAQIAARGLTMPDIPIPAPWKGFLASFYGGISEEVLLRLFLLSLLAWLGTSILPAGGAQPSPMTLWVATVLAAILFGLGHLPATVRVGLPLTSWVVARALILNGLFGLAAGWLYWRHGLEMAIVAHFSADIVLHVIRPLLRRGGQGPARRVRRFTTGQE